MVLETRNQKKRVQAPICPVTIQKVSAKITLDKARTQIRVAMQHRDHSSWSGEAVDWLRQMKSSMIGLEGHNHFDNEYWLSSSKTQDAIRRSLCESNAKMSKKMFCFSKNHSHIPKREKNGYFAL